MTTQNASTTRKNLLAHLTIAGGAALAGSAANAQVIVVPVNETVGVAGGSEVTSFTSSLPGLSQFRIFATVQRTSQKTVNKIFIGAKSGTFTVRFGTEYLNTPFGKKFSTLTGASPRNTLLIGSSVPINATFGELGGASPSYVSFRFANLGPFDYGWIELGGFTAGGGNASVTIDEYAYDLTPGQQLPNGFTSNGPSVPEPSPSLVLAAFSALALGAVGVRRLKALKAAA